MQGRVAPQMLLNNLIGDDMGRHRWDLIYSDARMDINKNFMKILTDMIDYSYREFIRK